MEQHPQQGECLYLRARSKSAIRSVSSSSPIDTRIKLSAIPILARSSAPASQKIVGATGMIKVRVSPRPVALIGRERRLSTSIIADGLRSSKLNSHEPAAKRFLARSCSACEGKNG